MRFTDIFVIRRVESRYNHCDHRVLCRVTGCGARWNDSIQVIKCTFAMTTFFLFSCSSSLKHNL